MKKVRKANSTKSVDFLNTPEKSVRAEYTSKFSALSRYINKFVERPDFKQNEIAEKLEMHESQVSIWLSGFHNLTIKSILKLESACDINILNPAIWRSKHMTESGTSNQQDEYNYTLTAYNFYKKPTGPTLNTGIKDVINTANATSSAKVEVGKAA
jgi:predicted XRE-type DNA-binding protein